jgi:hypothetical protein
MQPVLPEINIDNCFYSTVTKKKQGGHLKMEGDWEIFRKNLGI